MKIFGSLSELVSLAFRRGGKEVQIQPDNQSGSGPITITIPNVGTNAATLITSNDVGTVTSTMIAAGTIIDADVNANAGIAYSKLNLRPSGAGAIVNADISNSAAIEYSKLELSPGGVGAVVDGDISASAAISRSKLGLGTASHVVINDGSGNFSSEAQLAKSRGGAGADMTNVTFPSTGTLVTRDATESLLNKTTVSSTGAATGALTLPSGTTADRSGLTTAGMIRYNTDSGSFEGYASGAWSGIGGGGTTDKFTQVSPSLSVGDVVYLNGSIYTKALADAASTSEVVGVISRGPASLGTNNYEVTLSGEVSGLSGLVAGEVYFLSPTTPGGITTTEPNVIGQVSVPIGVASSATSLYVAPKRGNVVGGTNARTQIPLSAVTTAQTIYTAPAGLDAGELTGWVYLDATADSKFYVSAPFAKNGAGNDWNISPSYVGDTPPAGFSMTMTNLGEIKITMNPLPTGFVSGYINYALNAPAVGATFPLAVDAGTITTGTIAAARLPQVSSSSQGAFPSLTSSLDNATATQLGLKQYLHGTTYNGGIAPTVTSTQGGFSVVRAEFVPYQTQDGAWRMRFNIASMHTLASVASIAININGVVFKNISNNLQSVATFINSSGTFNASSGYVAGSNFVQVQSTASATSNTIGLSGDVELDSKPTWAY